jgi:hypothetical protein
MLDRLVAVRSSAVNLLPCSERRLIDIVAMIEFVNECGRVCWKRMEWRLYAKWRGIMNDDWGKLVPTESFFEIDFEFDWF